MIRNLLILLLTCACVNVQAQVIITTICGSGEGGYDGDGKTGTAVKMTSPDGICLDREHNIYFSDALNSRIRKIDFLTGIVTTVAGNGKVEYSGDGGPATDAGLYVPDDLALDTSGNLYIADAGNHRIRKVTKSTGIITTVAGIGPSGVSLGGYGGDNGQATDARLNLPTGIFVDKHGYIYISDYFNNRIRRMDSQTGVIITIAGNGSSSYSGDNGPATSAGISLPLQTHVDSLGNILLVENDDVVRKVDAKTGIITTIAGTGINGYAGDSGPATDAKLNGPVGITLDAQQNIYIAEFGSGTIRKIDAATGIITTIAGTGVKGFSGDGGLAIHAQLIPEDMCIDRQGRMYVADYDNNRIRMVYDSSEHYVGTSPRPSPKEREVLRIYPNPVSGALTIESMKGTEVSIYNAVGQSFGKLRMTGKKEAIDVSALMPGMYIIQILNRDGDKQVRRFVKE